MDFTFSDEQEIIKKSARDFFAENCDKKMITELEKSDTGHSSDLWNKMAALGWLGTIIPDEYGGVDCSLLDLGVIFEEIGRAAVSCPMLSTQTAILSIIQGGTEEQKKDLLPKIISGEHVLTMAVEEPEVSYDVKNVSLKAVKNGSYALSGTKLFVPYAASANRLIVAARTGEKPGDESGVSLFIVDKNSDGISMTPMKTMAIKQFKVDFDQTPVSSENVLGSLDNAVTLLEDVRKKATALQCAEMVGGAQMELEMTSEYMKIRHQFDRPLGTFQAVQHRLADMYIGVQGAWLAAYRALWCLSEGMPADREVSVAKYFANRTCQDVAFSAQQLHGGIGFSLEYDLHFYYRRAKALDLQLGHKDIHLRKLGAAI